MKEHVKRHSNAAGFNESLLPQFTTETSAMVKGTLDYVGVNIYTASIAKAQQSINYSVGWEECMEVDLYQLNTWNGTASDWLKVST